MEISFLTPSSGQGTEWPQGKLGISGFVLSLPWFLPYQPLSLRKHLFLSQKKKVLCPIPATHISLEKTFPKRQWLDHKMLLWISDPLQDKMEAKERARRRKPESWWEQQASLSSHLKRERLFMKGLSTLSFSDEAVLIIRGLSARRHAYGLVWVSLKK